MAEKARSSAQRAGSAQAAAERAANTQDVEPTPKGVDPAHPTGSEGRPGQRTATMNLPFVTVQLRAPQLPGRNEVKGAARVVQSLLPPPKVVLYYGALAVTAAVGVIEWPVAAAIGVGTALASRGEADPQPRSEVHTQPRRVEAPATERSRDVALSAPH